MFIHVILLINYARILIIFIYLTGHERESSWYSLETDLFWDKPANLSTDMVVRNYCCCMYINTDELSEQGNNNFFADGSSVA